MTDYGTSSGYTTKTLYRGNDRMYFEASQGLVTSARYYDSYTRVESAVGCERGRTIDKAVTAYKSNGWAE